MTSNPRHHNITGAPFTIGKRVRVFSLTDAYANNRYFGEYGVVEYYEYDCGCGQQFPASPMIGIRFADGELEEYWPEELED